MKILGLTGGIASGKSEVSKILSENRGYIIDADKLNHMIMLKGGPAYNEIIDVFGDSILTARDEIDRKKLGKIVFADAGKLKTLIDINHKYVIEETLKKIEYIKKEPAEYKFIVIDAPLLIEAGLHKACDIVCVVKSDLGIRLERILKRDGTTKEHAMKRIDNQMPVNEAEKYADVVIENNSGLEELKRETMRLLRRL